MNFPLTSGLLFSEKPKKTRADQSTLQVFYFVRKETTLKPSKVTTIKCFFSSVSVIHTSCFEKYFLLPCDNWRT